MPLLAKALGVLTAVLKSDADLRGADFNGRPYFRTILGFVQVPAAP